MSQDLRVFENNDFGILSVKYEDGKPLFPATDCAKMLGYKNTRDAILRHCKGVVKHDTLTEGGIQSINFIPEGDLYRLIAHSKLPSAQQFESWVFDDVLPSIRQAGGYIAGEENMTDEELLSRALLMANEKIRLREERIKKLEYQAEIDKPKVILADGITSSETDILVEDMAKILKQNGVNVGRNRLFEMLRDDGYLISRVGVSRNMPSQRSMNLGLMKIRESTIEKNGKTIICKTTMITGKGQLYFVNKYTGRAA